MGGNSSTKISGVFVSVGAFPFLFFLLSVLLIYSSSEFFFMYSVYVWETSFDVLMVVDFLSLLFFLIVGLVSTSVMVYSVYYMEGSKFDKKFMLTMIVFILSMFLLAMSADLFGVMIGWDGLGLSSLGLIMFYQNWKSFNSSMVTFLSNRLGDGLIIISLIWFLSLGFSKASSVIPMSIFSFCLIMGAFSKSAQVPFSAWLPLAMAAPTPVSSLVHSSTLVTAGVYLLLRFKSFLSEEGKGFIFVFACLTVLLATSSSMGEYDLKKIIALSTLSHVGLMMMFVSFSSFTSVMVHLHSHAMFKSLLFMIAGDLIHKNLNTQDVRELSMSVFDYPTGVSLVVSLMSMVGFPFLSGFYSKELFLCLVGSGNLLHGISFFLAASMTAAYSIRILLSLFSNASVSTSKVLSSKNWKVFSLMALFSLASGGCVSVISSKEGLETFPLSHLLFSFKKEIFLYLTLGGVVGVFFSTLQGVGPALFLKWIHFMWWVGSVCFFYQNWLFLVSWNGLLKFDSKGFIDFILSSKKAFVASLSPQLLAKIIPYPILIVGMTAIFTSWFSLFLL